MKPAYNKFFQIYKHKFNLFAKIQIPLCLYLSRLCYILFRYCLDTTQWLNIRPQAIQALCKVLIPAVD